jgi:hypothetical protein
MGVRPFRTGTNVSAARQVWLGTAPGSAANLSDIRLKSWRLSSGNTSFFTEGTRKWFGPPATARRECL